MEFEKKKSNLDDKHVETQFFPTKSWEDLRYPQGKQAKQDLTHSSFITKP